MDAERDRTTLQSVRNALRVLELINTRGSVTPSQIVDELSIGRSTVHRLLTTLELEDFVQRDRNQRTYRAGRALIDLGLTSIGGLNVRRRARSHLDEIAETTGETAHLLILEGANARIIDSAESAQAVKVTADTGQLVPAHTSAGGKALLAAITRGELLALFPTGLPNLTASTITSWKEFEQQIDLIRVRGYAVNFGEFNASVGGVAVPIIDPTRRIVASLALAVPVERLSEQRAQKLAAQLREHAVALAATFI